MITAFWHRGRREFVPLLSTELAKRAEVKPHQATRWLLDNLESGIVSRQVITDRRNPETVWSLTSKGRAMARGALA